MPSEAPPAPPDVATAATVPSIEPPATTAPTPAAETEAPGAAPKVSTFFTQMYSLMAVPSFMHPEIVGGTYTETVSVIPVLTHPLIQSL